MKRDYIDPTEREIETIKQFKSRRKALTIDAAAPA